MHNEGVAFGDRFKIISEGCARFNRFEARPAKLAFART